MKKTENSLADSTFCGLMVNSPQEVTAKWLKVNIEDFPEAHGRAHSCMIPRQLGISIMEVWKKEDRHPSGLNCTHIPQDGFGGQRTLAGISS